MLGKKVGLLLMPAVEAHDRSVQFDGGIHSLLDEQAVLKSSVVKVKFIVTCCCRIFIPSTQTSKPEQTVKTQIRSCNITRVYTVQLIQQI